MKETQGSRRDQRSARACDSPRRKKGLSAPAVAKRLDFLFDLMSPSSYLPATQLDAMAARTGATVRWIPVYLPGIMRGAGNRGPLDVPAKALYQLKDVNDWAQHYGLTPIHLPDEF